MAPTWRSVPALRAVAAFAAGIVVATRWPELGIAFASALVAVGLAGFVIPVALARRGVLRGGATLLLLAAAGVAYQLYRALPGAEAAPTDSEFFLARLTETPTGKGDWAGADAVVLNVLSHREAVSTAEADGAVDPSDGGDNRSNRGGGTGEDAYSMRVRLMFDKAALDEQLREGDVLVSDARIGEVRGPRNPHAFDYRAFLAQRGIRVQAWLRGGNYELVRVGPPPTVLAKARTWIADRVDWGFGNARDAGVAKALLIGDKSGIDEETRLAYTATGAVHVLAVSGLHTGIISAIVVWLLARVFGERLPGLQFGLMVATLAAYVALTGFAPSVIRASIMFAVVFGGRFWRRDAQGLNSLGVAAALTLLYDPSLLFTLGFQLSYLAVAGIMLFYQPLRRRLLTPYPKLHAVSELAAVSVAATVGTFPVTIFYFHQFPVYFALSGLIAVPLVAYALPVLLGTVALDGALAALGVEVAWLYHPAHFLVWLCNEALALMARLPHVLVEGLWPSASLSVLLVLAVWSLGVTLQTRRRRALRLTVALALLSTGVALYDLIRQRAGDEVTVYSLRDASVVDVRRGVYTLTASDGRADGRALSREVSPHRYATGYAPRRSHAIAPVYADSVVAFYEMGGVRWAELRRGAPFPPDEALRLDWVRVDVPEDIDPAVIDSVFPGARILLARRPPPWEREAWEPLAERTHLLQDGAFVLELDRE